MTPQPITFNDFITVYGLLFSGFYFWFFMMIKEKETRKNLIIKLSTFNALPFYQKKLTLTLKKLDMIFGTKINLKNIFKNIYLHYLFAISYVVIIFFIIWVLTGNNTLGSYPVIQSIDSFSLRLEYMCILFVGILLYWFTFSKKTTKLLTNIMMHCIVLVFLLKTVLLFLILALLREWYFSLEITSESATTILGLFVAGVIIVPIIHFVTIITKEKDNVSNYTIFILSPLVLTLTLSTKYIDMTIDIPNRFSSFLNHSIPWAGNDSYTPAGIILLFLFLIPAINAIFDFISLTISRIFFKYIADGEALQRILLHLLLDLCLAFIFLLGLALVLYFFINYYNTFVDLPIQVPIVTILNDTLRNPWHENNLWITVMLLSTLVPTLLHLIFAILTFLLYITKLAPWYANLIDNNRKYESQRIKTAFFMALPSAFVSLLVAYGLYIIFLKIIKFIF